MSKKRKEKERQILVPKTLRVMEILKDIERIDTILSTPIFTFENRHHPLKESAFVELMICLNDLLEAISKIV
jgi:hypothetical protein